MRRSYNNKQVNLQKLILSRLHQRRTSKLYVNSPIQKISSQKVASLVRSKRELQYLSKTGDMVARTSGTEERISGTIEKAGGTEEKTSGTKVITNMGGRWEILHLFRVHRTGGTEEKSGGNIKKIDGTKNYCRKCLPRRLTLW